jgi:hypothetical protein
MWFPHEQWQKKNAFYWNLFPRRETALPRRSDKSETSKPVDDARACRREKIDKRHGRDTIEKRAEFKRHQGIPGRVGIDVGEMK